MSYIKELESRVEELEAKLSECYEFKKKIFLGDENYQYDLILSNYVDNDTDHRHINLLFKRTKL